MNSSSYDCKIVRVKDGDTIDVMVDLGFDTYKKATIRIAGINCEEKTSKDPEKKAKAMQAMEAGKKLIGVDAKLIAYGYDKYGRRIGDIKFQQLSIDYAEYLLGLGLAVKAKYDFALEDFEKDEYIA